jgi:uncharacterized protein YndB with AHSA1/START domain
MDMRLEPRLFGPKQHRHFAPPARVTRACPRPKREQTINSPPKKRISPLPALLYKYPVAESSMTYTYHFVTSWRVKASPEEVYDIINQPLEYPRWWPSVYLDCRETLQGAANGAGHCVQFHTKGWLPYTLEWEARTTESVPSQRIAFGAFGDFDAHGAWTFTQDGAFTDITFDWNLEPGKPLLRYLTPVMRPVFEANHRWAMQQGEICLREELIRYRARTPQDLLEAADPRGPVEVPVRWIAVGALAVSALACIAFSRRKSRKQQTAAA